MAKTKEKNKKIVFSKKIDDNINGYSIGFTFIAIAVFLFRQPEYLKFEVVTQVVGVVVVTLGILMCSLQLSKTAQIEGLINFTIGATAFIIWLILHIKINDATIA